MKKVEKFFKGNYIVLNKIMIYFLFLSMSLFFATDYFPIIEILLVLLGIYILIFCIIKKFEPIKDFIKSPFFIWYIVFWSFVILMTILRNWVQIEDLLKRIVVFTTYTFGFGILYSDKETRQKTDICAIIEIIAVFLCGWILILEMPQLLQGKRIGFSVMTGNPNSAGTLLSIYMFFIAYRISKKKNIKDILALLLCFAVVLATGSKKAIVVAAMAFLLFLFKDGRLVVKRLICFIIIFVVIVVACIYVPFLYNNIGRRFLSLFGELELIEFNADYSSEARVKYIETAIDLWKEAPILGGGYDNFRNNSGHNTYSHNNYVELLSAVGIIGTLIYYSYYMLLLKKNILKKNMKQRICTLFVLATLLGDIGAVTFSVYPIYYIMLIIISFETEDKIIEEKQDVKQPEKKLKSINSKKEIKEDN